MADVVSVEDAGVDAAPEDELALEGDRYRGLARAREARQPYAAGAVPVQGRAVGAADGVRVPVDVGRLAHRSVLNKRRKDVPGGVAEGRKRIAMIERIDNVCRVVLYYYYLVCILRARMSYDGWKNMNRDSGSRVLFITKLKYYSTLLE